MPREAGQSRRRSTHALVPPTGRIRGRSPSRTSTENLAKEFNSAKLSRPLVRGDGAAQPFAGMAQNVRRTIAIPNLTHYLESRITNVSDYESRETWEVLRLSVFLHCGDTVLGLRIPPALSLSITPAQNEISFL